MKKESINNNELNENYQKRVEELKLLVENKSKQEKELLAYKIITDIFNERINSNESMEKFMQSQDFKNVLLVLKKALNIDISTLKVRILSHVVDRETKYRKQYIKTLDSYKNVLDNYKELSQKLNINSSLEISHFFTYLLWNGYFSVTKTHTYSLDKRILLSEMNYLDIINGTGVCLGYAEFLRDFLVNCGKEASVLFCCVPTKKGTFKKTYEPDITRNIEKSSRNGALLKMLSVCLKMFVKDIPNHGVTLIRENDKIYLYDPTNLIVLNIEDSKTANVINGVGKFTVNPLLSLIMEPRFDSQNVMIDIQGSDINKAFSRREIILSWEQVNKTLNENVYLLDAIYDNVFNDLKTISNQTKEIADKLKKIKRFK